MSRRNSAVKRKIVADPVYKSLMVSKLINLVMQKGKKTTASKIVYGAINEIQRRIDEGKLKIESNESALDVLELAIKNISPTLEVKGKRIGGANYLVPIEVKPFRAVTLAIRWIVKYSREGIIMSLALANELVDGYNKTGKSYKKREDTHKMAEANRAFAGMK